MFKKKSDNKKTEKQEEFVPRFVTEDEYFHALYILENAIASGQVVSKEIKIMYPALVLVEKAALYPSEVHNRYTPTGLERYSTFIHGGTSIGNCDFRSEAEIVEARRKQLEAKVKEKRESIDKEVAELEKLSKELGNLK